MPTAGAPLAPEVSPPPAAAPRAYRLVLSFLGKLVRVFFRQVEVTGLEHVPEERGGIVISWHPNGLVDPGLILTSFPRQVIFGARHGLFRWPLLGLLFRSIGTVPIFRVVDDAAADPKRRKEQNQQSLGALADAVARGSFSALFPEGVSHDDPYLRELKTGVARLYYRARELTPPGRKPPVILPVGLYYDEKRLFRSRALVWFHPPLELPAELDVTPPPDEADGPARERARALTTEIERVLSVVVGATEDWATHHTIHRCRKLIRAERAQRAEADPGRPRAEERALGFARIRAGYYARLRTDPERVAELRARIERYEADLLALELDDHELDRDPRLASPWLAALLLLQAAFVFLLLPPVLLFGTLANAPTALLLWAICKVAAKQRKDEATIKLLIGALVFPLTWLAAALLGAIGHEHLHAAFPGIPDRPILAGASLAAAAALGGSAALRYLHRAQETARSIRVRLTRRRQQESIAWLLHERSQIHDQVIELSEGLDLPGVVAADGTVKSA